MDKIFKALADENRRKILEIVRDHPGINVHELSKRFVFSRFATMKHIKILEEARLLIAKREWKDKHLYLNATPIYKIYEKWIVKFKKSGEA